MNFVEDFRGRRRTQVTMGRTFESVAFLLPHIVLSLESGLVTKCAEQAVRGTWTHNPKPAQPLT